MGDCSDLVTKSSSSAYLTRDIDPQEKTNLIVAINHFKQKEMKSTL